MTRLTSDLPVQTWQDLAGDRTLKADAVVVGSGAGGAVMAFELAQAGLSVLVLEAGPFVPSEEFNEIYPDMLYRLYQDHGRQMNADGDLVFLQGRCVGGSTVLNAALAFRTPEHILHRWEDEFGLQGLGNDLAPWFDTIERRLGVHVNMPHEISINGHLLEKGCDALGYSHKPLSRNVRDCVLSGYCLAGCASDRKQSMLVTYLPWAMDKGAQVLANCEVDKILHNGTEARGVVAQVKNNAGEIVGRLEVHSKIVVAAAGAVQTPLLMQRSGIPDSGNHIGRHFACHPSLGVLGMFDEDIHSYRGATCGSYCDEFDNSEGGFIFESGSATPDFLSTIAPGFGTQSLEFMHDFNKTAGMISLIHDDNIGEVLWQDGRKVINYRIGAKDAPVMKRCLEEATKIYLAAGARYVNWPTFRPWLIHNEAELKRALDQLDVAPVQMKLTSYHPQGTSRMGREAGNAVVGVDGESHTIRRLFVSDASLFPTSIMVNPQMTVYALSSLISQRILLEKQSYFG